jgi:Na+/proline symporter
VGVGTYFFVKGKSVNFFVAGRSLPLWVVAMTLGAQSIDSNAILGNADLSYRYGFWDGAVIPIGLGLSLILNGIFLAHHINDDELLTLPDAFSKRYGSVVEVLVSLCTVCSFLMLLAGNLVGFGAITSYIWDISDTAAIFLAAVIIWLYTCCGGLFSVAYTDVVQGLVGWSGCAVMAFWFIANESPNAPPPSIGFPGTYHTVLYRRCAIVTLYFCVSLPHTCLSYIFLFFAYSKGYIYPDLMGEDGICDMYDGVACDFNADNCCYNTEKWCPMGSPNCDRYDRAAYPIGDQRIYAGQMTNPLAMAPFPNAILWNWATILILGFGNLAALDFQARCMAAKTPNTARLGCIIGGLLTFFIGVPFAYLGAITR